MGFHAHLVEMNQQLNSLENALLNEYGYPASHNEAGSNLLRSYLAKIKASAEAITDDCEEAHEIVLKCDEFRDSLTAQDGDPIAFDTSLGIKLGFKVQLSCLRGLVDSLG